MLETEFFDPDQVGGIATKVLGSDPSTKQKSILQNFRGIILRHSRKTFSVSESAVSSFNT